MAEEPSGRNWSTKTLARQLARFLADQDIGSEVTVGEMVNALKSKIVEEEVGVDLDIWGDSE